MKDLQTWWDEENKNAKTAWLILGKGPTFDTRDKHDLTPYKTIAVNHVVREMRVDVASAVNFEVVGECADALHENCRFLLMPRYPHTIIGDAPLPLEEYFTRYPVLQTLSRENRLIWYNLSSDTFVPGAPVIRNCSFSVSILFNLLGHMGAKRIRTLGVDGGVSYGAAFASVAHTRLANGMTTYDHQFNDMMDAVKNYHLNYRPLGSTVGQRVFLETLLLRRRLRTNPRATLKRLLNARRP